MNNMFDGKDPTVRTAYMCETDFEHHIESDVDGTTLYPTERICRLAKKCIGCDPDLACEMVQVEVRLVRIVG